MLDSRDSQPSLWWLGLIVGGAALVFAVIGIPARASYGARTTADEPQYLITALSLANDGDLDISDEIAAREFEPFHEISLNQQTYALDDSGKRLSPHDPLLPLYLAPFMAAGGWEAAKFGLALLSAATAIATYWVSVRRFATRPLAAAVIVIGFWAGAPLSAYGTQIYPEMPAALCVVVAVGALTGDFQGRAGSLVVWLSVACLPWLAVKYAPVAVMLALASLVRFPRRRAAFAAGAWLVAGVAYLGIHQRVYGGWTVYAAGDHFATTGELSVLGNNPDYFGRSRRLVGLLVDRRFGIAAWHPGWFLAPLAMTWLAVRDRLYRAIAIPVFGAGLFTATFVALTMHGWWFPGRQLVVVLPLGIIAVAKLASDYRRVFVGAVCAAAAGAVNWLTLVNEASSGQRTLIVDFWDVESLPYRAIYRLLPDGLGSGAGPAVGLVVWAVIVAASMFAGARLARYQANCAASPSLSEV